MKIETAVTITRDSNNLIRIGIIDRTSHIKFLELQMTLADFAMAITGLGCQAAIGEAQGLEYVGMARVTEDRKSEYPYDSYRTRAILEQWLLDNCQEEGWIVDPYLGSQGSVHRIGDKTFLNYKVRKYVPAAEVS